MTALSAISERNNWVPIPENWFLSPEFANLASTPYTEMRSMAEKGFSVFALRRLPRKFVICYRPVVVRRLTENEEWSNHVIPLLTKREIASRVLVGDLPTTDHKDAVSPIWRGKAMIGQHVHVASEHETSNVTRQALRLYPIVEGEMFYVPIVANRDIEVGSEILL